MEDRCICCGEIIPEGMMACPNCLVASKKKTGLKPCEYCGEKPILQKGIEFTSLMERYRYHCPRCNIQSKSAYTIDCATELWNRSDEDG